MIELNISIMRGAVGMPKDAEREAPIRYFSEVRVREVDWLWHPYIPFGKITVIQGDPGDGKTTLILNIAALLSRGLPMPESTDYSLPTSVLYQSAEDGAEDTLKPRLMSAGADCSRIAFIDESECGLTLNDVRIENAIKATKARLLVLDPLQAYLGEGSEMNRADGIRPMLKQLAAVAERTGCAIVIVGHMNKASGSKSIYRGLGSIDITAVARSVLLVGRIKNDTPVRVMAQQKNSLAKEGTPIAFEINEDSGIRWIGEYDISVDELLNGESGAPSDSGKVTVVMEKLTELLADEEVPCGRLYEMFREMDMGKRTVDRAKKALGVRSVKRADGWYWML